MKKMVYVPKNLLCELVMMFSLRSLLNLNIINKQIDTDIKNQE